MNDAIATNSICFVTNIIESEIGERIELIEGACLRKASIKEADILHRELENRGPTNFGESIVSHYEEKWVPRPDGNGFECFVIEKEEWNYWVVEQKAATVDKNLLLALQLSDTEIFTTLEIWFNDAGEERFIGSQSERFYSFITNQITSRTRKVTTLNGGKIENFHIINKLLNDLNSDETSSYQWINSSLDSFFDLPQLPNKSPFRVVALISILETLLVTDNTGNNIRSITHQLKTKLNLMINLFVNKIDPQIYFKESNKFETVIEKLYSFRSSIAHGDESDFVKKLSLLETPDKAKEFLYILVREALKLSLREPQLINDLKQC